MRTFACSAWLVGTFSLTVGLYAMGCGGGDTASSTGETSSTTSTGSGGSGGGQGGQGGSGTFVASSSSSSNGTGGMGGVGGIGGTGGTAGAGGTGGAPLCQDGETLSCYSGDPTTENVGVCVAGIQTCTNGMFGPCVGEVLPSAETCNDGTDENCDGMVDENCPCVDGSTQPCYSGPPNTAGQGECMEGVQTCLAGNWGACTGEVTPVSEVCDNLDNDCNGQVDDGLGDTTCGIGACEVTVPNCVNGMPPPCVPGQPTPEVCNGIDDDCNIFIDDGLPDLTCGLGECVATAPACVGGQPGQCVPGQPAAEQCDGLDNNCDGQTDEGNPGGGGPCMTNQPGVCAPGTFMCTGGMLVCTSNTPPSPEICDGQDNDCNGQSDEGNPGGGQTCNTGQLGVCADGLTDCVGGAITCTPETTPSTEVCDGLDNNCNGSTDEGNPGGGGSCNTGLPGVCSVGTNFCVNGQLNCTQDTQPSPEVCDGQDNNCDGQTDENNPGGGGACMTGLPGVCSAGTQQCQNGQIGCVQTNQPSPEVCDNQDNNCNGQTDENNPGGGGACNTGLPGICSAGTQQCQNGQLNCVQNNSPSTEICDNQDNNCNGQTDEGNPGGGGACNTGQPGVCSAGTQQCQNGQLNCVQNNSPSTEICDNQDNNCNGQTDEGNPGGGAACNTGQPGVCAAGTVTCQNGSLQCVPNVSPSTETCDGQDNNCNGQTDEGNPGGGGACNTGQPGACSAGTLQCQSGMLNCVQTVFPSTEVCDGADNDCDGAIDEGNPGGGGSCNTGLPGVCGAGTLTCAGGMLTCQQNVGPSMETCGDALDNDCDGSVDEGCMVVCAHDKCTTGVALNSSCDPCVGQICAVDSFCCTNSWDSICVGEVSSVCNSAVCPENCAHSPCTTGGVLTAGCDSDGCVQQICAVDPFCCQTSWDSICVGEVSSVCGKNCN